VTEERPTPEQEARSLYEEAESRVAKAAERVVSRDSFGELLAMATENIVALTRMSFDGLDLVWSNLRLAGRRDMTRLGRQLGRTEDKLELVLQEVERLRDQVEREGIAPAPAPAPARAAAAAKADGAKPTAAKSGTRRRSQRSSSP
jgi:hypothetical protein